MRQTSKRIFEEFKGSVPKHIKVKFLPFSYAMTNSEILLNFVVSMLLGSMKQKVENVN